MILYHRYSYMTIGYLYIVSDNSIRIVFEQTNPHNVELYFNYIDVKIGDYKFIAHL